MRGRSSRRDEGAILPLVIACTAVIAMVAVALATYATTDLKYGQVTEDRSDRLAAADAGMRYAIDQIKLRNGCVFDDTQHVLPGLASQFNGASARVTCKLITDGLDDGQLFALAVTGAGTSSSDWLLSAQGGGGSDEPKTLGGPVYVSRATDAALDMSAPLIIEDGMLYYYDDTVECTSISQATVIDYAEDYLSFEPPQIFGPWCLGKTWQEKFKSPWTPDLTGLAQLDGTLPIASPGGSYEDIVDPLFSGPQANCRVFPPGRYTNPPDLTGIEYAYFMSGDYVFDFDAKFDLKTAIATFGSPHPYATPDGLNEQANSAACEAIQDADTATNGATIYLAKGAYVVVETGGTMEVHARAQGNYFVSIQALCHPQPSTWCRDANDAGNPGSMYGGDGGLGAAYKSTLTVSSSVNIMLTKEGNGKEFIAHGYFYAPLAKVTFGNATADAEQKMLGGLVAATVDLQSSASATNFEIAVPTSPLTGLVEVTSTATKDGQTTQIRSILEFRYNEELPDERVRVNSWRVCQASC
jgi:hypothetical protein